MTELFLCGACLNNEAELIHIDSGQLRDKYNAICGEETQHLEGVSQYLCVMCAAHLNKMTKLRELCLKNAQVFQQVAIRSGEEKMCTDELLDITPILSFPKSDTFTYSEINHDKIRKRDNKLIFGSLNNKSTFCYEINDSSKLTTATNINESSPKVIIKEDIKLDVSNEKPEVNHTDIINENSNNDYFFDDQDDTFDNQDDTFDNQENMFDTNNSNTSYPDTNIAVNNLNDNSSQHQIDIQNNSLIEKHVITDSIELPEQAKRLSKRLRIIEYFAKLELLPEKEVKASYELIALCKIKESKMKETDNKGFVQCRICPHLVQSRLLCFHNNAHWKGIGEHHCCICFVNFPNKLSMDRHIVMNHMFKYICRVCSEVSFTMEQAEIHYKDDHCSSDLEYRLKLDEIGDAIKYNENGIGKISYLATFIPKHFIRISMSAEERVKVFQEKQFNQTYIDAPIKCGICYLVLKTKESLSKHIMLHTPKQNTPLKCTICKMYFGTEYLLYKHTNRTHEYKYSCNECGHIVYSKKEAMEHRPVHAVKKEKTGDPATYTCSHCNQEFESKGKLERHLKTHYNYFCCICGQTFRNRNATNIHVSLTHNKMYNSHIKLTYDPDRTSQLYCGECEVQFVSAHAYNRHLTMKQHTDATAVECYTEEIHENVSKSDPVSRVLRTMNCHICGIFLDCGKTARDHYREKHTVAEYTKHIYTTVLKCDQCDYSTKRPRSFKWHLRKHKVDFTIPCPTCGKRFPSVLRMKCHQHVHSDERRFECAHCNKKFKTRQRTNLHISTVHLKIPYMPWVRRAERRKQERALLRQKQEKEFNGKDKNKSSKKNKLETLTEREETFAQEQVEQDNMMYEEQYTATEYLTNFAQTGNVVFGTHSRY